MFPGCRTQLTGSHQPCKGPKMVSSSKDQTGRRGHGQVKPPGPSFLPAGLGVSMEGWAVRGAGRGDVKTKDFLPGIFPKSDFQIRNVEDCPDVGSEQGTPIHQKNTSDTRGLLCAARRGREREKVQQDRVRRESRAGTGSGEGAERKRKIMAARGDPQR